MPTHDTPFPAIVKGLKAGNRPGRNPVFQVIFAFHDSAVPILDFAGIRGAITERHNKTAKTDMNLICIPRVEQHITMGAAAPGDEDLTLIWEYNSEIFERDTIEQMISHYVMLLRQIVRDPRQRVRDLTMVTDVEIRKLLELSAGERAAYYREKTLPELFEEQVRRHPDRAAVVHNGQVLSYSHLSVARQQAGPPTATGVSRGARCTSQTRNACGFMCRARDRHGRWYARHPQGRGGLCAGVARVPRKAPAVHVG